MQKLNRVATLPAVMALLAFILPQLVMTLSAQETESLPWQQRDRKEIKPLAYDYVREADVMWSKNIWRIIDTRQKMNHPFNYPQRPLIQVIHEAAKKGDITVYDPAALNADRFTKPMAKADVEKIGARRDSMITIDPSNPDREIVVPVNQELTWDKIKKYRVKQVWFFDTKSSTMQVRIIGIAPVMEDYDENGNYRGDMTMYWIPYASLRDILAKEEVFNPRNDSERYSWEDLFEIRNFASYIYKESNVYDRNIQEYASGIDAQLESDRIKQELFEKEHDLWSY